ncbi:orotidine-5'-phosphate decarboxylase, partial [Pelagibacteraceae bacterium]|nr:orotidine-5'-phosphate decarboxylase [Pelagibacteraceae bacterium]
MNKKIIVALDLDNIKKTIKIVKKLKKEVYAFKIGHEFFYNFGIKGYKEIYNIYPRIFLDLKLHDIPNTVQKGLKAISKLNPIFTTIHISGGDEMQKISALKNNKKTNILGVTVLTSLNEKQTLRYYKEKNVNILVKKFANYAKKNNLSGLVCSPLEISIVRKEVGKKMILVVP